MKRSKGTSETRPRAISLSLSALPFSLSALTLSPSAIPAFRLSLFVLCLFGSAFFAACGIGERRSGLPTGAQAAVERLTEHFAERRFAEIYAEAADEWRAAATPEQSQSVLSSARERLGRVVNRASVRAAEQGTAGSKDHTLSVSYNTKFERADAIEQITLVEREGRWLLARYSVSSDALK